jgi:hypothetical protein
MSGLQVMCFEPIYPLTLCKQRLKRLKSHYLSGEVKNAAAWLAKVHRTGRDHDEAPYEFCEVVIPYKIRL